MAAKFKLFANNTLLPAADLNGFLMRQTIIECNSTADRDNIPAPTMGMTVLRKDLSNVEGQVYETYTGTGTTWRRWMSPGTIQGSALIPAAVASGTLTPNGLFDSGPRVGTNVSKMFRWPTLLIPHIREMEVAITAAPSAARVAYPKFYGNTLAGGGGAMNLDPYQPDPAVGFSFAASQAQTVVHKYYEEVINPASPASALIFFDMTVNTSTMNYRATAGRWRVTPLQQ